MARKRMLSSEIIHDENYNNISLESQLVFIRMLTISDDCGVVPGSEYTLKVLLNLPNKISCNLLKFIKELIIAGLIEIIIYDKKLFYCFKPSSFDSQQAYIIKNRTKSEYIKIKLDEFIEVYNKQHVIKDLQEIIVNYSNLFQTGSYHIESNKYRVISKEIKKNQFFEKPELQTVKDYFAEKNVNSNEYERFFDFYESKNWFVGKNKMKDWKASVRNWIRANPGIVQNTKVIENENGKFLVNDKNEIIKQL